MKHLFVPYEIALKLKEKGFDEECLAYFHISTPANKFYLFEFEEELTGCKNSLLAGCFISAPLFQQVIDWLRKVHNIHLWIVPLSLTNYKYHYFKDGGWTFSSEGYGSYQEALDKVIDIALTLI